MELICLDKHIRIKSLFVHSLGDEYKTEAHISVGVLQGALRLSHSCPNEATQIISKILSCLLFVIGITNQIEKYTMQNIFSIFLCFASVFAHISSISTNFNFNDENRTLGKLNHEFTDAISLKGIWGEHQLQKGSLSKIHSHIK